MLRACPPGFRLFSPLTCYVGDSNEETVVLDEVKSEFKEQVRMEGFGQLQTPVEHNAKNYQYLAKFDSRWRIYDRVLGNANNTLIPKGSCATDDNVIKHGSRIQILLGEKLITAFGTNTFEAADSGKDIKGNHIDLYWGCDAPSAADPDTPAGLSEEIAKGQQFRVVLLSEPRN